MLFNDGPEVAPFLVTVKVEGSHQGGGAEYHKPKLPFEVSRFRFFMKCKSTRRVVRELSMGYRKVTASQGNLVRWWAVGFLKFSE